MAVAKVWTKDLAASRNQTDSFKVRNLYVLVGILGIILGLVFSGSFLKIGNSQNLKIYVAEPASSLDPLDFDLFKHHALQSLLTGKLVSFYNKSLITPALAESWVVLDSGKEWRIKIRTGVFSTSGKKVDSNFVALSLKRAVFLLNKHHSKLSFVRECLGVENLVSANQSFPGINSEGDWVVIKFKTPQPRTLETLGFGLFGIVDSINFDSVTGEWKKLPIDSFVGTGPYRIVSTSSSTTETILRSDYPEELRHKKAFPRISFLHDKSKVAEADMGSGPEDSDFYPKDFSFYGRGESSILYFFIHPWNFSGSQFHNISFRQKFRILLMANLEKRGLSTTRSFFPKVMPGITEPTVDLKGENTISHSEDSITFFDVRPSNSSAADIAISALEDSIQQLGVRAVALKQMKFDEIRKNKDPTLKVYSVDVGAYATGISPTDPEGDIRLMFSKEGIWLPDPTGRIGKIIKNDNFSAQDVNQALFEDSIIIPIKHISLGFWASSRIDLSQYDVHHPLGELQWIGAK